MAEPLFEPTVDFGFWKIVVGRGEKGTTPLQAAHNIRRAFPYLFPTTEEEAFRPTQVYAPALWFCTAIAVYAGCSYKEAAEVCAEVIPEVWADHWFLSDSN